MAAVVKFDESDDDEEEEDDDDDEEDLVVGEADEFVRLDAMEKVVDCRSHGESAS